MRSEQEMMALIRGTARSDDRIRAAILNGSRANPSVPGDPFQDFDAVYFVTDVASFRNDPGWISRFGERMIMQTPDDMPGEPPRSDGGFCWLMQFTDGNRIDLSVVPVSGAAEACRDSQTIPLLDKDGILPSLPPPSEKSYLPTPPTAREFGECCNEFWWVCPYVAKGLWRSELAYARHMLDQVLRNQLLKMLEWHVGVTSGFRQGPGKFGRHLRKRLRPGLWALLETTYAGPAAEDSWNALFGMCSLFRMVATGVAGRLGFEYPVEDDKRVTAHLRHVQLLPPTATEIY